jgi:uncharacterized membrane protein (UPF0127 family)
MIGLFVVVVIGVVVYFGYVSWSVPRIPVEVAMDAASPESARAVVERAREMVEAAAVPRASTSYPGTEAQVGEDYEAFKPLFPITLDEVAVLASVARTPAERALGLSGTTALPEGVVKLFVFDASGPHAIWMKEMRYDLDILWLDSTGLVVHLAERVTPSSYPNSFASPVPALYVIEAPAGFLATHNITVGSIADLANIE